MMTKLSTALATRVGEELQAVGSEERAKHEKRYLKSDLRHFGASVPAIRKVARRVARDHPDLSRRDLIALIDELWTDRVHEKRMSVVELLDLYNERLEPSDLAMMERLIRESKTWALVDGLAASVVSTLLGRFPKLAVELDRWAQDEDFWIRRSALLALLAPLRRGEGDFERFARYADAMLDEREFFIRKAIGWVLRDTSRRRPDLVYEWLKPRAHRASGVTVREAVKYLSADQREEILASRY
jgi:3-methyladenine DNA glycosylase AlkD